jgi:hypothetical protein
MVTVMVPVPGHVAVAVAVFTAVIPVIQLSRTLACEPSVGTFTTLPDHVQAGAVVVAGADALAEAPLMNFSFVPAIKKM